MTISFNNIVCTSVYQIMEQQNLNSSETTKDIPSNHLFSTSLPSSALPSQTSIATAITAIETSSISEGSDDCSINSIGYTADVSELQQANNYESPVKNTSTNQGQKNMAILTCFILS